MLVKADWAPDILREQVEIQDKAFDRIRPMIMALRGPAVPGPRSTLPFASTPDLERLRNAGDEAIGQLLKWAMLGPSDTRAQRRRSKRCYGTHSGSSLRSRLPEHLHQC